MEFLHPILGPSLTGEVDLITTRNAVILFEGGYVLEDPFKFAVEGRKARAPMAEVLAEGGQCFQREDGIVEFRLPDKTSNVRARHAFYLMPWELLSWPTLHELWRQLDGSLPAGLLAAAPAIKEAWTRYSERVAEELKRAEAELEEGGRLDFDTLEGIHQREEPEMSEKDRATLAKVPVAWRAAGNQIEVV